MSRARDVDWGADGKTPVIKITAMPGKHVPPSPLAVADNLLSAMPPTNGWLLEMGWSVGAAASAPPATGERVARTDSRPVETGYRVYISGDTLFVDELGEIPKYTREQQQQQQQDGPGIGINLIVVHPSGTTIPGPLMSLLMVTMDTRQGVEFMRWLEPDLTIPVPFDHYSVTLSSPEDLKTSRRWEKGRLFGTGRAVRVSGSRISVNSLSARLFAAN
ncbi:hypothetical protein F4859DRAFT_525550 [Xylaria cf. heliscus]|nr:hypothetical protein F4859DRAFT_525550 [Xylaria cf. heliscus]